MPALTIEGVPTNLKLPEGSTARRVDADLFNICERLKEISPQLSIVVLDPPQPRLGGNGRMNNFAIMQNLDDVEWLVFKCEYLDARVLQLAAETVHVPLQERLDKFDKEKLELEQKEHEDALDNLYETMGGPMAVEFYKNGFITTRPTSYRPMNKTARRAGRKMD